MILDLSQETRVSLLLTSPLMEGTNNRSLEPRTPMEFLRLSNFVTTYGCNIIDFISPNADEFIQGTAEILDPERIKRLLAQGFLLAQMIERWNSRSIWVLSQFDHAYPKRFFTAFGQDAPILIYGCGDPALLDVGGLAVVGSRNADESLLKYAEEVGCLTATSGKAVISGVSREIDQAAMRAVLSSEGISVGIMADSLERAVLNQQNRIPLKENRLVLISPYHPGSGFNTVNDLQRNKLIYALADAALIISSDYQKGGIWAGAVEQLEKLKLVTVYVRSIGVTQRALQALISKGARPWPNPKSVEDFNEALALNTLDVHAPPKQAQLSFEDLFKT